MFKPLILSHSQEYTEQNLILGIKNNSEPAYKHLYDNYGATLYGHILRVVENEADAQDVLQDVFINIWRNVGSYNSEKGRLYTWIFNIARNRSIDFIRSKRHQISRRTETLDQSSVNAQYYSNSSTDTIGIRQKVGSLEPKYQEIVDLVYFHGYRLNEVSKYLDVPTGTVKTRLRRAICILRKEFEPSN